MEKILFFAAVFLFLVSGMILVNSIVNPRPINHSDDVADSFDFRWAMKYVTLFLFNVTVLLLLNWQNAFYFSPYFFGIIMLASFFALRIIEIKSALKLNLKLSCDFQKYQDKIQSNFIVILALIVLALITLAF